MGQIVKTKFILTGPLAGQSVVLGSLSQPFEFVEGEFELVSTIEDRDAIAHYLKNSYQVYREGHIPEGAVYGTQVDTGKESDQQPDEIVQPDEPSQPSEIPTDVSDGSVGTEAGTAGVLSEGSGPQDIVETPKPKKVK